MNLNIAFNTIIYIMVFLFPGILCRRAFFSGDFNKHFESGNSFERLIWNILVSILMLVAFCTFIYSLDYLFDLKIEFDFKFEDISDTFICIYENQLPTVFISKEKLITAVKLLFTVYFFSALVGIIINRLIFYLGLEKRFSILRFQNNWQYLTNSNKQNNISHNVGDIHYTRVDVKTKNGDLFTGKLHLISYDKEGKIEAISIQDAYKFKTLNASNDGEKIETVKKQASENDPYIIIHTESVSTLIYRKRIKGNLFTILNNDIENISITYIKISNFYRKFQRLLKGALSIIILAVTVLSISYAIWDFKIFSFENYFHRLIFCLITPIEFILVTLSLYTAIGRLQSKNGIKASIMVNILFAIPYLYTFSIFSGWTTVLIILGYFIIMGFVLSKKSEK